MPNTNLPYEVPESASSLPAFWKRKTSKENHAEKLYFENSSRWQSIAKGKVSKYGDFDHF